jgi:hypothetical protein
MYEKQLLRELEALRPDVNNAAKKVTAQSNGVPRPSIIPPLEDFSKHPGLRSASVIPANASIPNRAPSVASSHMPANQSYVRATPQSAGATTSFARQGPLAPQTSAIAPQSFAGQGPLPPQSPGAGSSKSPAPSQTDSVPRPAEEGPPLGGKFVDGTKSMFIKRSSSPSPLGTSSTQINPRVQSPLHSDPLGQYSTMPSVEPSPRDINGHAVQSHGFDPLGQAKPSYLSQSVRVTPTRQRLDAREAASKLANMF